MTNSSRHTPFFLFLVSVVALVAVSKIIGPLLFTNNWSFTQWQYLPLWWPITISAITVGGILLCWKQTSVISNLFENKWSPLILSLVLLAVAIFYSFDSFLYGGGNLTVSKISQADVIIKRPYEFGAMQLVSWFFYALKSSLKPDAAAALAWQIVSWGCAALSLWWGWQFSAYLSTNRTIRTLSTLAIFLGPSAAMLFGFIAPEPILVAVTVGVARFASEYFTHRSMKALAGLWIVILVSALLYLPCLYLFPVGVYTTLSRKKEETKNFLPLIGTVIAALLLLAGLYYYASKHLELTAALLFFKGKNPNSDYGLFSIRHVADMLQLLLMAAPQLIVILYLLIVGGKEKKNIRVINLLTLLTVCGLVMMWLFEPTHSIMLDAPLFLAYLTPVSLLAVTLLFDTSTEAIPIIPQKLAAYSFVSLFVLLSWFPLNRSIIRSQDYVESYFKQHDNFYMTGIFAFRDALFADRYIDLANAWEAKLLQRSPEYIDLQGCQNLSLQNEDAEAVPELFKIITNHPYWGDPRYILAGIQLKLGRPDLARPQLDTALLLEPYNKLYLMASYGFHRGIGAYTDALDIIKKSLVYYPSDSLILSDYMIISLRAGDIAKADSLRKTLRQQFPNLSYPFLVEGLIAEQRNDLDLAKRAYERFIAMAPNDPDAPKIRKMLNNIILQQERSPTNP